MNSGLSYFIATVPGEWGVLDAGFGGAPVGVPGCIPVAFWWTIGGFTAGTPWGTAGAKKYFFQINKIILKGV